MLNRKGSCGGPSQDITWAGKVSVRGAGGGPSLQLLKPALLNECKPQGAESAESWGVQSELAGTRQPSDLGQVVSPHLENRESQPCSGAAGEGEDMSRSVQCPAGCSLALAHTCLIFTVFKRKIYELLTLKFMKFHIRVRFSGAS